MKPASAAVIMSLVLATGVMAHEGVTNPAVMARMHAMSTVAQNLEILGDMAKGKTAFSAEQARAAAGAIALEAARTPALFQAPEQDPKSEARATIWEDFPDFTARSDALEAVAADLSVTLNSADDLGPAMRALGQSCQSCHAIYRD